MREVGGGQEVPGRRVISDGRESELVLDIVRTEELGSYTCAAKNSLGEASALLILPGDTYSLIYNTATHDFELENNGQVVAAAKRV